MVVHIGNSILNFSNIVFKLIFTILVLLFINSNVIYCNTYDDEFNKKLTHYTELAKKVSNKQRITELDINNLLNSALSVLEHIKFNNLYKKFNNVEEIVFKSSKSLNYNNNFEENVIKFTVSFFEIFTTLNLDNIKNIIAKSPLELIPLLKEMNVFTKFITANASDYGYSKFSEMQGTSCKINTTKDALMHIMGALINIYLINPSTNKLYKLSNTASTFYYASSLGNKNNTKQASKILYTNAISKLNRNINNNERVSIFMDSKS